MLRIAICDDETTICSHIENIIMEYSKYFIIKVFYTGERLVDYIEQGNKFDLIFLDIELNLLNGIQVGKKIRQDMNDYITKIVYISGRNCYDRELFDVQPLNFIPKPIIKKKVVDSLQLSEKLLSETDKMFTYSKGQNKYRIPIKDIIYFESINHEINIVTTKETDVYYGAMKDVAEQLSSTHFILIHRSYLINYNQTRNINYEEITMSNNKMLSISRPRRKEVRQLINMIEQEN